jgi:16S rRNA processing protein RimM
LLTEKSGDAKRVPAGASGSGGESGSEPILVGSIARAHGLTGELVVDSFSDVPGRFATGSTMTAVLPSGETRALRVTGSRPFTHRLLVRFEGIEDRVAAEALHGADMFVPRSEVPPLSDGRHYRFELIGLMARTPRGDELGRVTDVFATGSNDVYVLKGPRGEILLPALPEVIVSVDVPGGVLVVEPPKGLPGLDDEG